jgi:hypothetical protein
MVRAAGCGSYYVGDRILQYRMPMQVREDSRRMEVGATTSRSVLLLDNRAPPDYLIVRSGKEQI